MHIKHNQNAAEQYFVKFCVENFSDNLLGIINTDSYIRQPCYSSRAKECYYLILLEFSQSDLVKLKYIQGEFPEFFLNYLTHNELKSYPSHGKWQFCFSPALYLKAEQPSLIFAEKSEHIEAIRQALFGIGHIARLYFLRDLDNKTHTWAVRQLGWALRYAEHGILKLWNYLDVGTYDIGSIVEIKNEIQWLLEVNSRWRHWENEFLSEVEKYREASLKLNVIVEYFSEKLINITHSAYYVENTDDNYDTNKYAFISTFRNDLIQVFNKDLKAFYLHGSAARGDQHQQSDIDSIAIFSQLNENILKKLRKIVSKYPGISVSSLSLNDLINYPSFRFYSICFGSKKMYGNITFNMLNSDQDMQKGILNNLYTILQVARAYLLVENYGPRAPYMLKLMAKLTDHGCMRLIIQRKIGVFPNKKEEVKDFFKEDYMATKMINYVLDMNRFDEEIKTELLQGNNIPLKEKFLFLIDFVKYFLEKLQDRA